MPFQKGNRFGFNRWSLKEEDTLKESKGLTKQEIMAIFPNRTWKAIREKAKKLKIHKLTRRVPWCTGLTKDNSELVKQIGHKVSRFRSSGGERMVRATAKMADTVRTQYQNGRKPWNRGKRGGTWNKEYHDTMVLKQADVMRSQGFRVIPLLKALPDLIAIKDGMVFAVEVELSNPNYKKYVNIHDYNDIIWVRIAKNHD